MRSVKLAGWGETSRRDPTVRPLGRLPRVPLLLTIFVALVMGAWLPGDVVARTWTDASGKHGIEAEFVKLEDGVVHLKRPDGESLQIPLEKLSQADQDHAAKLADRPAEEVVAAPAENVVRLQSVIAEGAGRKKDEAIANAVRIAVRQSLVTVVAAKDIVKQRELIESELIASSGSFVRQHQVLSEKRDSGIYHVKIKADVLQNELVAELKAAGIELLPDDVRHRFSVIGEAGPSGAEVLGDELAADVWAVRKAAHRDHVLKLNGGDQKTEESVQAGLKWLATHQNRDGSWSFNHTPGGRCSGFPDPGTQVSRMGATGMALLPFLGAGHTHKEKGEYQKTVRMGLAYLVSHMNSSGLAYERNGSNHTHMYCHGIASCAIIEAYGMTKDKKLRKAAKLAVDYIAKAQGDGGGWRYQPREPGDTSVVGWQVMTLKSAKMAGLDFPKRVYSSAMKFLDSTQKTEGQYTTYQYMPENSLGSSTGTTAIGLLSRIYMGWPQNHAVLTNGVAYCQQKGFQSNNMYYNYYASQFLFQEDGPEGEAWKKWNEAMKQHLFATQDARDDRHVAGSWFFSNDQHHGEGQAGGRLYHTIMATLMLETYYRYGRFYEQQ